MRNPSDTFGPYELWEDGDHFGAEFRYLDATQEPPAMATVRVRAAGMDLTDRERALMYAEITARCRPGTQLVSEGSGWTLRRKTQS